MTEQYQCPFCDYQAASKGSVKGHITKKTDNRHKEKAGPNYTDKIKLVSVDGSNSETVVSDDAGSDGEPESEHVSTGTNTATADGGIVPESDQYEKPTETPTEAGNDDDETECPGCGSTNYADSTAYLRQYQDRLEAEHISTLRAGEYVCGSCGGVW